MKRIPILFLLMISPGLLGPPLAFGASGKCPNQSVILKGSSSLFAGYTYRAEMELHKVSPGAGYDGKWQVVRYVQENTYPHRVDQPGVPKTVPAKPVFWKGVTMDCLATIGGFKVTNVCTKGNLTFRVSGNRIGPAATPIGKISGNTMTIHFDKNNPIEPDKVGTIQNFAGGNLNLSITQPGAQAKYVYSSDSQGKLTVNLKAQVSPAKYANDVQWNIPDIPGSTKQVSPANGKGSQVEVNYQGLPAKNSSFGKKTVTASVDAGSCKATDTKDFQVFFPRDAGNHPGGSDPNWFYYWSQTKAKKGPAKFGGNTGRCGSGGGNERLMGYYRNTIFDSVYYICDLKKMGPAFPFKSVKWVGNGPDNRSVNGIDTFAAASHHENAHYEHFTQWWKAHRTANKFEDTNRNGIKDSVEQVKDKDKDEVPDSVEPTYGMDPTKKSTLGAGVVDEEAICWKEEASWQVGSANQEDWANPGKQWK